MIDDIIISEADFSNDSFSQCQISECAPTESISSMILTKNSKLNLLKQTSAEDFFFGKLFNSPLRLTQNSKSQDQESRNQFKQKALGKLAWALFEEELSFELFNSEENYGQQQKNIDFQRNNVITSEFLLEEETEQKDTIKDLKLRLNINFLFLSINSL